MAYITALDSFPNYTDYKDLGKLAYATAVAAWLSSLLAFQTEANDLRDEVVALAEAADVAKIVWKGTWAAGSYAIHEAVKKDGSAYISNKATSETPSLTATDWDVMVLKGDAGADGSNGVDGNSVDHISKTSGNSAPGTTDIYTMWGDVAETINLGTFAVYNGADGNGAGDMTKAVYDTTDNGIVDNAEKVNGHTVESDVPAGAVFTDTLTTINDTLTSISTTEALSANQGYVLKGLIDNLTTLLTSDDTTLDTIQEIVDFITLNKATLDTLGIANIAGLQAALDAKLSSETVTSLSLSGNILTFTDEDGTANDIDLSSLVGSGGGVDYTLTTDPAVNTNPANLGAIAVNSTSGEIFICTDKTTDANIWKGTNGTVVSLSVWNSVFGRMWNITDDVYKRVGLDQASFGASTNTEFTSWLSASAARVNDNDTATPSDLTTELDTNTDLPFSYMARKVVANDGTVSTFDHSTIPSSTEQIMTEVPKFYYIDMLVVSESKEYDIKLVGMSPFTVDVINDLGFASVTSITCFNPTTGISSGTVSGNSVASAVHPAFVWADDTEATHTYIGSFHSVSGRSTFGSGVKGTSSITLPTARTQHTSFGTNFSQHDFWNNSLVQLLAYIERGSNYLEQSGTKFDGYSWRSSASSYDQDNGLTLSLENKTGTVLDGSSNVIANSYRGIENYHSALWQWVDGININSGVCYLAKAGAAFASDTSAAPYFNSGYTSTTTASWQNINKWYAGTFIPNSTAGGTTSTKVSDQMYGTTGWRVLRFGGALDNAGISGLSCWSGSNDSSASSWARVSRASFRKF